MRRSSLPPRDVRDSYRRSREKNGKWRYFMARDGNSSSSEFFSSFLYGPFLIWERGRREILLFWQMEREIEGIVVHPEHLRETLGTEPAMHRPLSRDPVYALWGKRMISNELETPMGAINLRGRKELFAEWKFRSCFGTTRAKWSGISHKSAKAVFGTSTSDLCLISDETFFQKGRKIVLSDSISDSACILNSLSLSSCVCDVRNANGRKNIGPQERP